MPFPLNKTNSDNPLWLQSWRDKRTNFHQLSVNPFLKKFWPGLKHKKGSRVFVPLCGKSIDMIWLANNGHEVIGVELSPIAVKLFFKENKLQPRKTKLGEFTLWQHKNIRILCGDYFSLTKKILGDIDIVYDRAALTALAEDIRLDYIKHLKLIVPQHATIFLLTIEDAAPDSTPELTMGIDEELAKICLDKFKIKLSYVESVIEADPDSDDKTPKPTEYKVYQLSQKEKA